LEQYRLYIAQSKTAKVGSGLDRRHAGRCTISTSGYQASLLAVDLADAVAADASDEAGLQTTQSKQKDA
jgi:hypothetical protein